MEKKKMGHSKSNKEKKFPLKFKSISFVAVIILLMAAATILVAMPRIRSTLKSTTQNYMYDLAECNGKLLDIEVTSYGVSVGLSGNKLKELFSEVKVKGVDNSSAYVVGSDGTVLFDSLTDDKVGQPVDNDVIAGVAQQINTGEMVDPGVVTYEQDGASRYVAYYVNPNGCFVFAVGADESDVMGTANFVGKVMVVSACIVALICLVIAFIGFQFMFAPLKKIAEIISRMGDLDFVTVPELEKLRRSTDETGLMARTVCVVQEKLSRVVTELQVQSRQLYRSSDNLSGNATMTADTVGEISRAVQDIAKGANSQAGQTQEATDSVLLIGDMVRETNHEVTQLRNNVQIMHESGIEVVQTLKELEEINTEVKNAIEQIYEQTNTTNESAKKIKDAILLITSIADETNLLSLNASIEAARAGEQGKGFAVVANQIQKLAEQSNESAMRVQEITNMVMEDSAKAVQTMDKVKGIMDTQMEKVDLTGNMFTKVQNEINRSIEGITKISQKTEGMDTARVNVVDIVQSLTAIAEQNAAGTEQTSSSVTEVSQIVDDISNNARQLQDVAKTIEEHMKEFKV